jgi:hypothetical protein
MGPDQRLVRNRFTLSPTADAVIDHETGPLLYVLYLRSAYFRHHEFE